MWSSRRRSQSNGSWLLVLFLVMTFCLAGRSTLAAEESIGGLIDGLNLPEYAERHEALLELRQHANLDDVRIAMIHLLENENSKREKWWEKKRQGIAVEPITDEGYGEYYLELVKTVTSLRDVRAVPALIGASSCATEIQDAIADFGEVSIGPLEIAIKSSVNPYTRRGAMKAVVRLANKACLPETAQAALVRAILPQLEDTDPFVRKDAVAALGEVGDSTVLPILEEIMEKDPYNQRQQRDNEIVDDYPIREQAEKAISEIMRRMKPG